MVISACLTQLFGWVYILPLCLFGLVQIKFGDYLNKDYLKNSIPRLAAAARTNPIDIIAWIFNATKGGQQPQPVAMKETPLSPPDVYAPLGPEAFWLSSSASSQQSSQP